MDANQRLIQVFITHKSNNPGPGIFEVSTDPDRNLSCNCPGFIVKSNCKHVALVESRISANDGKYPFDFSNKVTNVDIKKAMKTEESFREFIIKYGKVEVY